MSNCLIIKWQTPSISSKAVGEPPALSVFSAIRAAAGGYSENAPLVFNAPATAEEILRAIAIGWGQALDRPQAKM